MIYIRVRCKRCSRVLDEITSYPADFTGQGALPYCPKCSVPPPDRFADVAIRRDVDIPVLATFEWSTMRRHVERALATGKPVTLLLS